MYLVYAFPFTFCFLAFCHIFKTVNLNTAAEETCRLIMRINQVTWSGERSGTGNFGGWKRCRIFTICSLSHGPAVCHVLSVALCSLFVKHHGVIKVILQDWGFTFHSSVSVTSSTECVVEVKLGWQWSAQCFLLDDPINVVSFDLLLMLLSHCYDLHRSVFFNLFS